MLTGCEGEPLVTLRDAVAPIIRAVQVEPTQLPFMGGKVKVSAQVSDASGVNRVIARLKRGGEWIGDEMELKEGEGDVWEGEVTVPGNSRADRLQDEYKVLMRAMDTVGNETSGDGLEVGKLRVAAPLSPPAPLF